MSGSPVDYSLRWCGVARGRAGPPSAAYGHQQVSPKQSGPRPIEFPTWGVNNVMSTTPAGSNPGVDHSWQLVERLEHRVGLDGHLGLGLERRGLAEDAADPELPGAPDVGAQTIADHERFGRAHVRELQRPVEHRAVRLAPADVVGARDRVDRVGEPEPPPVLTHLVVAAPERVRDQNDGEAPLLAPAE